LTLAILPNVVKKKYVQRFLYFGIMTQPMMAVAPKETRQVLNPEHMHGSSRILEHSRIVKLIGDGNKKVTKTKKSKKKKQTPKHSAFACMRDDDPRSIKLAKQFDVEQRLEYIKSLKNIYSQHHY
jgi:hypothetical protein